MRKLVTPPLLLALAIAIDAGSATGAHARMENPNADDGFWRGGQEGWFFYNEEKPKEKKPEPKPEPPEPPKTQAKVTPPPEPPPEAPAKAKEEGPEMFSAEWFRVNIPKYRDAAWNEPTVENVQTFMYLQRYMMDRSQEFADAAELAVLGHPWLDEANRRPNATSAARRLDRTANASKNKTLEALSERAGIFFFYKSTCESCSDMSSIVSLLRDQFKVIPISVDGKDLPGNPFPDFRVDQGHAEQIGVKQFPSLYLASADGEFAPFAHGPVSLNDARHRMIVAAKRMNWITEEEFNATRPVRNLDQDLSQHLDMEGLTSEDDTNFIEPSELLQRINQSTGGPAQW